MKLNCKECGAGIPAEDVSLENLVAKCRSCGSVFSIAAHIGVPGGAAGRTREKVALPKGLTMDDWGGSLTIVHRWFTPKYIALVVFCAFWDGFLVFWYSMAFKTGAPLVMVLFPLIHLAVGVFLTYATVAGFVNRTRIQVEPDSLTIRHGPIPWPGNRTISSIDIEQLFTKEKISHGKHGTTITYELHAAVRDGGKVKLVSGLDDPDQVLFMEQEIEARLKIQDRPVAGELPRG